MSMMTTAENKPGPSLPPRYSGTIKFFNPDKGYGFIRREGGQDVFVHANELRKSGIVDLEPIKTGSRLEFAVEMVVDKGPKAISIVLLAEA
jgi:CspA family cold shock protein